MSLRKTIDGVEANLTKWILDLETRLKTLEEAVQKSEPSISCSKSWADDPKDSNRPITSRIAPSIPRYLLETALGRNRNMYYSLMQSLIRQDPAYHMNHGFIPLDYVYSLTFMPRYTNDTWPGDKATCMAYYQIGVTTPTR